MIKWVFRLLVLVVILAVLVVALTDTMVKEILVSQLNHRLGIESSIENVDVHFLTPRIKIENCVLYNSAQFGGARFLEAPEITIEYDFERALKREVRIKLLRINLATINIVADKLNRLNFEELFKIPSVSGSGKTNSTPTPIFIEVLNLSIGKVKFMNLENPSNVREVSLSINNYIVRNISSRDLNGAFFHNLILKILLDSGKVEIRDGKIVIKPN